MHALHRAKVVQGTPPAEEAVQTSAALCRKSGSYPGPSNRADVVAVALRTSILSPEYGGSSVWQGEHVVAAGVRGLKGLGLLSWDLSQGVEGEGVCFKSSPLNPYISLHGPRRNPLFQPCVIPSKPQALSPNCSEKNLFCCLLSCPSLRHVSTELPLPDGSGLEAHHHPRYQQRLQQLREPRRGLDQDLRPRGAAADSEPHCSAQLPYVHRLPCLLQELAKLTPSPRQEAQETSRRSRETGRLLISFSPSDARRDPTVEPLGREPPAVQAESRDPPTPTLAQITAQPVYPPNAERGRGYLRQRL